MGATESARATLLLLYTYTCLKKDFDRPEFLSLLEHDRFSQVFCYSEFLIIVLLSLLLHNTD